MSGPAAASRAAGWHAALALLTGLTSGALFWSYYRVLTLKFPLDFINPSLMVTALLGLAFGVAAGLRPGPPRLRTELLLGAGLLAFGLGNILFKDASVHFLFGRIYYAFPRPTHIARVLGGHLLGFGLSPLPFFLLGRRAASLGAVHGRLTTAAAWCGAGLGLVASYVLIPEVGGYAVLLGACTLGALTLKRRAIAAVVMAGIVGGGFLLAHPPYSFFTWQLRDYERIETYWTPYYKIDFLRYDDNHCVAGIHNNIMLWSVCDEPSRGLLMYRRLARALSGGPVAKKRVLSAGRAEGSFAQAMKAMNPRLEHLLTLDFDAKVTADLSGRLSHYNGGVFASGPCESRGGDMRLRMDRETGPYDIVYLNGPGIMLFFYPMTIIPQEDYLFSSESFSHIFDGLLSKDGIVLMDRGVNSISEAYMWAGSLPVGVHIKIFWTKLADHPFTGVSLGYVMASRNQAELDRIARDLTKGQVFREIPVDPARRAEFRHTDNWPFMQPGVSVILAMVGIPFAIGLALLFRRMRRRLREDDLEQGRPVQSSRTVWRHLGEGITACWIVLWIATRGSRSFLDGAPLGFVVTVGLSLGGIGIAAALWSPRTPRRIASTAAVLLPALGLGAVLLGPVSPLIAAAAAAIAGIGAGVPYLARAERSPGAFGLVWLGALLGVQLFQGLLVGTGFRGGAAVIVVACALLARQIWRALPAQA